MKPRPPIAPLLLAAAALALAAWVGGHGVWLLVVAAGAALGGLRVSGPVRTNEAAVGLLLVGAVVVGFVAEWDLHRYSTTWHDQVAEWEDEVRTRLSTELDLLLRTAEVGGDRIARAWETGPDAGARLAAELPEGLHAAAVFGPDGEEPLAWTGVHQGPVPPEVRSGEERYMYREGALFGYLYLTHPLRAGEGTVMMAALLRADLPPGLDQGLTDFTSRFRRAHGADIRISRQDRVEGTSVWDLRWEDRVLFSVTVDPLSEADTLEARARWWHRAVALAAASASLLLLALGSAGPWLALLVGGFVGVVGLLPLGPLLGAPEVFAPAGLLLPFPPGATLGHVLVFAAVALFLLGIVPARRLPRAPAWAAAVAAGPIAAGLMALLSSGASGELLAGDEWGWATFQATALLVVGLVFTVAIRLGRRKGKRAAVLPLLGAIGCAAALAVASTVVARRGTEVPELAALFWIAPVLLAAYALPDDRRWATGLTGVIVGTTLAASVALPWGWSKRLHARMEAAQAGIERLGTRADPFLEFLLFRAGEEAIALADAGRDPVEILYGAWTRSGLAREDVPVWLTAWSPDGSPREELRIGVAGQGPAVPFDLSDRAVRQREVLLGRHEAADLHYVMVAPLARGAVVSAVVPPLRALAARAPLGALFSPARGDPDPLVLLPLLSGEQPEPDRMGEIRWVRSPEGWQGEFYLDYPDGIYHAHYPLEAPGPVLMLARGTLLMLLVLAAAVLLWAAGRRFAVEGERGPGPVVPWLMSFRGRVTLTLFGFFLAPSLIFGTLAYRTLAGAAARTAETLAEHAVEDAANWYLDVGGAIDLLAARTGSDLLLYEHGEIAAASLPELVRLGLYEGWLPAGIHTRMMTGEAVTASSTSSLGAWDYVVAYRRIGEGRVLAAPAPLEAGATALRQREVADILGFTVVLGGGLSVLLSFLVGRALARPIQTLRIASERVGAGNMGARIRDVRSDEFGEVFSAFNRMVDRLARTRRALVQNSRRTRAIMEDVATGVVALDADGRIILANARAEEMLGVELPRSGHLIPGAVDETPLAALASWIDAYLRDGLTEAATELQLDERRVRVRARRVGRGRPSGRGRAVGGAVISMEDVTDELRTERILAWGEMARQVAHEVKNPLTPIKLGVQHVRRAWIDARPDFPEIFERNVEAILREIDRLDAIASGFSRYGAPTPETSGPARPVDVGRIVLEILALYGAGDGPVRFEARVAPDVPRARARPSELKEVLVNLLENARAALPEGGSVVVSVERSGERVELRVADDGTGIEPDLVPRIFDPHFSTRSAGSGLGLAIVRRLVEAWGGSVWVESQPGQGTTVVVTLPPAVAEEWEGADETVPSP